MSATRRIKDFLAGLLTRCRKCWSSTPHFDGYCLDCWPGYNGCADQRCTHYRCEHVFPDDNYVISYSRDNPQEVGLQADMDIGCMNAGCPCKEFQERPKP